MPIYEYVCPACLARREVLQNYRDKAPLCQECEGLGPIRMKRQPSVPAFTVSGFNAKNGYSSGGGPA